MIVDKLLELFLAFGNGLFDALPAWDIPVPESVQHFVNFISYVDGFAPFTETMTVFGLVGAYFGALVAFKAMKWVWDTAVGLIP